MTKICTSIEQSKKLIELGIDMDTADMSYSFNFNSETYELSTVPYKDWIVPKYAKSDKFEQVIPTWSLSALLNLMPKYFSDNISTCKLDLQPIEDKWNCAYIRCTNQHCAVCNFYYDSPLDAAFEMVCWLLENKKIIN